MKSVLAVGVAGGLLATIAQQHATIDLGQAIDYIGTVLGIVASLITVLFFVFKVWSATNANRLAIAETRRDAEKFANETQLRIAELNRLREADRLAAAEQHGKITDTLRQLDAGLARLEGRMDATPQKG